MLVLFGTGWFDSCFLTRFLIRWDVFVQQALPAERFRWSTVLKSSVFINEWNSHVDSFVARHQYLSLFLWQWV